MIIVVMNAISAIVYRSLKNVRTSTGFEPVTLQYLCDARGFIAQLVRASHRYREVTGSNPVEILTFQVSIRNCLNCVHNCDVMKVLKGQFPSVILLNAFHCR